MRSTEQETDKSQFVRRARQGFAAGVALAATVVVLWFYIGSARTTATPAVVAPPGVFAWEVSVDGGSTWAPVTLPDTDWGCTNCTRYYRTFVAGQPGAVTFRWGSDNEARMRVNGTVVYDDYYVNGVDWCTQAACCSQCCDTFSNCTNVVAAQAPLSLDAGGLSAFTAGINEISWEVNQQSGGSGFYTEMDVDYDTDDDGIPDTCDVDQHPEAQDYDNDGIIDAAGCDTVIGPPTNKDQCKNGGWQFWTRLNGSHFRNQGDCIQYVNNGH